MKKNNPIPKHAILTFSRNGYVSWIDRENIEHIDYSCYWTNFYGCRPYPYGCRPYPYGCRPYPYGFRPYPYVSVGWNIGMAGKIIGDE